MNPGHKWVPVIEQGYCIGCGRCVKACQRGCLSMVWDFATLTHGECCDSGEKCAAACQQKAIRMDWVPMSGDPNIGRWRHDAEPRETERRRGRFSLRGLWPWGARRSTQLAEKTR